MASLAGAVVFALMRLLSKQRGQGPRVQYAGFGNETVAAPPPSQLPGDAGVQPDYRSQFVSNIPAGFDVEGFLKEARRNFLRVLMGATTEHGLTVLLSYTSSPTWSASATT